MCTHMPRHIKPENQNDINMPILTDNDDDIVRSSLFAYLLHTYRPLEKFKCKLQNNSVLQYYLHGPEECLQMYDRLYHKPAKLNPVYDHKCGDCSTTDKLPSINDNSNSNDDEDNTISTVPNDNLLICQLIEEDKTRYYESVDNREIPDLEYTDSKCKCHHRWQHWQRLHAPEREQLRSLLFDTKTDLVPGQYEGGFKVWECTHDLIQYLHETQWLVKHFLSLSQDNRYQYDDNTCENGVIRVLELGCGSGLLSQYISTVLDSNLPSSITKRFYLQDYNKLVLQCYTLPNWMVNQYWIKQVNKQTATTTSQPLLDYERDSIHFQRTIVPLYGDWSTVAIELATRIETQKDCENQCDHLCNPGVQFDLIITSETLYSEDNYAKLYRIFEKFLRKSFQPNVNDTIAKNAYVLIATKSHYFGVGGGTYSFLEYIDQQTEIRRKEWQKMTTMSKNKRYKSHKRTNENDKDVKDNEDDHDQCHRCDHQKDDKFFYLKAQIIHQIVGNLTRHIIMLQWTSDNDEEVEECESDKED